MPQTQAWFFVVMSNNELPPAIDMQLAWSPQADDSSGPPVILAIPVKLTVKQKFSNYRFSFENQTGILQPIN
jgi:hypothetical protein